MTGKNVIDSFADLHVVVLGDVILDSYVQGSTHRLAQEAPVPVVVVSDEHHQPGGAANTAANLADLGAKVSVLSVAGKDRTWRKLASELRSLGVDLTKVVTARRRSTIAKQRVVSADQILLRIDDGSVEALSADEERALIERLEAAWRKCDAVVVSDYDCGVLTPAIIDTLGRLQRERPIVLTVDSRRPGSFRDVRPSAAKPNYSEMCTLLGETPLEAGPDRVAHVRSLGERVLDATGATVAAVTMDVDGSIVFERGVAPYRTYTQPRPGSHANGAGDTFVSALTLALAGGTGGQAAAEIAATAAAVVLGQDGTTTCSAAALKEAFSSADKILPAQRVAARAEYHRKSGKTVVFTNGCFDILHRGHIAYLEKAKALGDVLVVAVNSDASVRRLKGPDRPVNTLEDRMRVLASLACVDHVVAFGEDTPVDLIRAVRPHVFVKGGDYEGRDVPEAQVMRELGGEARILPYIDDTSTTLLIERIRRAKGKTGTMAI